ncbi:hypothetical protein AWB70_04149 [Caballeronia cordobensis]|uniref:Uncharacterized protein n=1 Tax=Caballeronia cordobensis TaxID=1353886 RepID=A0A158I3Q7_CABCO|nr:helix-turn-helix domain-containing protein [Caballeronia cordobensis]SAL51067.1 hypothetical protein AWB70_04149 [Caballeronia cordobensis]
MTALAGTPISRDPLALAELYHSGLGTSWTTQRGAVDAFARFTPKVTYDALCRAITVSKLPPAVLALFETAGIWHETARQLTDLVRKHGPDVLCQRASEIDPLGRHWTEIIDLLDGRDARPPQRIVRAIAPLKLAAEYKRGIEEGRWTSTTTAVAASPSWNRTVLQKAVAISELPAEVLELFELKQITYDLGARLVKIRNAIGESEMTERAKKILSAPRRRTIDEIVASLLQVRSEQGVELAVRREKASIVFEFKVALDESEELMTGTSEIAALVQVALMNVRFKRNADADHNRTKARWADSKDKRAIAKRMVAAGRSLREIAADLAVSKTTVARWTSEQTQ